MALAINPHAALHRDDGFGDVTALLHAVVAGCPVSFARLYALTSPGVFGVVLRINPDRADAEDVMQEVYVQAWTRCVQFDAHKGSAMHWLTGIARYGAIDSLRRRRIRPQQTTQTSHTPDDDPYAGLPSAELQPLDALMRTHSAAALHGSLRALSNEQRESLTLAFCDGLSYPEIAQRLGRPVGTVKSWVRRALAVLRPALAGHR